MDLRVLLPDDVDEQYFVEQLVQGTSGAGAPRGAVEVELDDQYSAPEIVPVIDARIVVHLGYEYWNGERIDT